MSKFLQTILLLLFSINVAYATKLRGYVYDKQTGEPITGAAVRIEKSDKVTITGLDGSFELKAVPKGNQTVIVSYLSYRLWSKQVFIRDEDTPALKIYLESESMNLRDVTISGSRSASAEQQARKIEQQAAQVMNVVPGRAIEVSPDLTVANIIQRVSGVSVERNSNGDAQHAILRGMDKRYNYTLVNGIKIPSPDNQYRYVPLDLFPSDLMERLEVYKTLTPNMEGDAVGGVINMVMKDAPEKLQITANLASGMNQLFMDRKFMGFDAGSVSYKSPYERYGKDYQATSTDFSKGVFSYSNKSPQPNLVGSLSVGRRFWNDHFGIIVAGSYQNTYRGSNSTVMATSNDIISVSNPYVSVTSEDARQYSEQQKRYGIHTKADWRFNARHSISLYNVYFNLGNQQIRDVVTTNFNGQYNASAGNAELVYSTRSRLTEQQIYSNTLHGEHKLLQNKFLINWSGVYSFAKNDLPDYTSISLNGLMQNFQSVRTTLVNTAPVTQRWERNTDEDKAGYLDLSYFIPGRENIKISFGGLYRDKQRSNFYNNYSLSPLNPAAAYGTDFTSYNDIALKVNNPTGAVTNALTYKATEETAAGYGMIDFRVQQLQVVGGARVEHTDQGYKMLFAQGESRPEGKQVYTEVLPSLTLKYKLNEFQQLHASYFRSLNRPGFYELIPGGLLREEYTEKGNPDLKHAIADNLDLRYELFPQPSQQLLAGVFYKKIQDPIEITFQADAIHGQTINLVPGNFGTAHNYGAELDYVKYFSKFGVKANYTYTHSRIKTEKSTRWLNPATNDIEPLKVTQSRPLLGQADHVANLSFLYKDNKKGWDAQLAGAYTGERINTVSQYLNNDVWQKGFLQMDFSAEKRLKNHLAVFLKAGNLLNTPQKLVVKGSNATNESLNVVSNGQTIVRQDYYKQSYLLGLRYKL